MGETKLGKITEAYVGRCGYQRAQLGLHLRFSSGSWGCATVNDNAFWDCQQIKCSEGSNWTELHRSECYSKTMREIALILDNAGVDSVQELVGIPVEMVTENGTLKEWRVLTEVL